MEDHTRLAETVGERARALGWTVAVAESLTAGRIASALGSAGDAALWLRGGVVAYASDVKFQVLGVTPGPVVTETCAREMADGVRRLLAADVSVAVTGVGGPDPEEGVPAGTVHLAVSSMRGTDSGVLHLAGDPAAVVSGTVAAALVRLAEALDAWGRAPAGTSPPMTDVVDLIMSDHREVERLFNLLKEQPEKRATTLPVLTTLLMAHSRAEESEVYPAAAEAGGGEDVKHSQKEHLEADQLLARLADTDPEAPEFDERLQEVIDAVTHHVEEEETTVLPGMRTRMEAAELDRLGERFATARAEHLGEQPGDITREQLEQQARNIDLDGASSKTKDELATELKAEAES